MSPDRDSSVLIPVNGSVGAGFWARVDADDFPVVSPHRWRAQRANIKSYFRIYARTQIDGKATLMHRFILGLDAQDPAVDHINGDPLDNRRSNLRLCSTAQNAANRHFKSPTSSSRFRGVTWNQKSSKWQAALKVNQRSIYLGLFESEAAAARAYDIAAVEHFGDFARLNLESEAA